MQIYYFSRTGRSEKIANDIAKSHGMTACKIEDNIDWGGAVKYVKAGYMASKKTEVPITHKEVVKDEDVILVFPIWASTFPPAILTFINKIGKDKIIAVPTSYVSKLKDRDEFINVYDLMGKEIEAPKELLN